MSRSSEILTGPDKTHQSVIHSSRTISISIVLGLDVTDSPHREQISNRDTNQRNQPTSSQPLDSPSRDEHSYARRECTNQTSHKEDHIRSHQDGLPPKDIRNLGPHGCRSSRSEKICRANPGISCRRVKMLCDGRQRRRDNCLCH
jgi:hypothetical protein